MEPDAIDPFRVGNGQIFVNIAKSRVHLELGDK